MKILKKIINGVGQSLTYEAGKAVIACLEEKQKELAALERNYNIARQNLLNQYAELERKLLNVPD